MGFGGQFPKLPSAGEWEKKPGHGFQSTLFACVLVFAAWVSSRGNWQLKSSGYFCVGIHMSLWPREFVLYYHWAVTQRPSEPLPNLAKASISVPLGSCAGHWWKSFYKWWCWLIPDAKVPVKLESVREDLHSCALSCGCNLSYSSTVSSKLNFLPKCNKKVRI